MITSIVYLLGSPGVGKYTIACELAKRSGAVVVDNQLINHPILTLFNWDGASRLPEDVLSRAEPIRDAVLSAIEEIAPASMSYVLTNALEDGEEERALFERVGRIAATRGSVFVTVLLSCELEEQLRRVVSEKRTARFKVSNAAVVRRYVGATAFFVPVHANLLELDTTDLPPGEAAEKILRYLESLPPVSPAG